MPSLAPSILEGTLVAGKYRVSRTIGRGGMGVVLAAEHGALAQAVALKVLSSDALASEEVVGRFLREARAAAGLKSEFVARVTDYGALDDGRPFMAMELLDGEDLGVAFGRELPVEEVVDAIIQACAGLAEAHAAGIVHRDLKPSNLFRTRRPDGSPCTKVLDFGISKVTERANVPTPQTSTRSMLGTPLYMSPEQVRNAKTVDARTDVWSLGVVLYEALTGRPPFLGETLGEVFAAILQDDPPSFASSGPTRRLVPGDLEQTVMACLARKPEDRIPSVKELALRLAPHASLEGRLVAQRAQAIGGATPPPRAVEISDPTSMETLLAPEVAAGSGADVAVDSLAARPQGAPAVSAHRAVAPSSPGTPGAQTLAGSVTASRGVRRRSSVVWIAAASLVAAAAGAFALTRPADDPHSQAASAAPERSTADGVDARAPVSPPSVVPTDATEARTSPASPSASSSTATPSSSPPATSPRSSPPSSVTAPAPSARTRPASSVSSAASAPPPAAPSAATKPRRTLD